MCSDEIFLKHALYLRLLGKLTNRRQSMLQGEIENFTRYSYVAFLVPQNPGSVSAHAFTIHYGYFYSVSSSPLQYYPEALTTQHGYCVGVSCRNWTESASE